MTINATAMWLLAMYQVVAEEQNPDALARRGGPPARRHHPERHHQGVPLPGDLRLRARGLAAPDRRHDRLHGPRDPEVEPDQHLQLPPAGGRRDARAGARLRHVHRDRRARPGEATPARSPRTTSRRSSAGSPSSSTPACGSSRRPARCGPSCSCGTRSPASATASQDPKMRRFRYGVQVNSLGLTEAQPENNVQRIVLEMLGVTLSKNARARAVQLPAWNEALGLPRPWDQQWSLRLQQVLAFESDLLEYDDIFDGSPRHRGQGRRAGRGGEGGDRPRAGDGRGDRRGRVGLHEAEPRLRPRRPPRPRIESGEEVIVGVNKFETTEPSPLTADLDGAIMAADPAGRAGRPRLRRGLEGAARRGRGRRRRWRRCAEAAKTDANLMHADPRRGPGGRDDGGVGRHAARGLRRVPGAHRRQRCGRCRPRPAPS